jgi:colicin import membrane protein
VTGLQRIRFFRILRAATNCAFKGDRDLTRTLTQPPKPPPLEEKPFYGWRYINHVRPDGTIEVETVLLTLEDVLHPQEDDVIPENSIHVAERGYLYSVFHDREGRLDHGLVLSDCIVDWGVEGLGNHSPDISVFAGLTARPPDPFGTFRLRPSGGRCLAAIELVSPHTRKTDVVDKPPEYHRAKVPLFVLIDQKLEDGPRELRVFRYAPEAYKEERPERVLIAELGLWIGLKENRVVCYDAASDEEIGDYTQVRRAREAAEQARQAAEQARQVAEQRLHELEAELRRRTGN